MERAIIVWGGWDGHEPQAVARLFERVLSDEEFKVESHDTLDVFADRAALARVRVIIPCWTMGKLTAEQEQGVCAAVREDGVGVAGCHGGMCDAFREATEWQFMTGGQWVAHPGNDTVRYIVNITPEPSPITEGIGQGRITANLEGVKIDYPYQVTDEESLPVVFDLLKQEGLCLGASSGVNVAGAIRLARDLGPGHVVTTILCDSGTRYTSRLFNSDFLRSKNLPVPDWLDHL